MLQLPALLAAEAERIIPAGDQPAAMTEILLLDAFSLVYRAFFALPAMSTTQGEPTGALYGFSTLLLKLLRESKADGVAIAPQTRLRDLILEAYEEYAGTAERATA